MKKCLQALPLLACVFYAGVASADTCDSWKHKAYPVSMQACSYPSGGSGYAVIANDGDSRARICYTIVANNGRELEGCVTLDRGGSSTPACSSCGSKNGGARHILLRSYEQR